MALILSEREHPICFKLATNRVTSARLEIKVLKSRAEKVSPSAEEDVLKAKPARQEKLKST